MNEEEKDKYIYLLERFKDVVINIHRKYSQGWRMEELEVLKELEEFANNLDCNE